LISSRLFALHCRHAHRFVFFTIAFKKNIFRSGAREDNLARLQTVFRVPTSVGSGVARRLPGRLVNEPLPTEVGTLNTVDRSFRVSFDASVPGKSFSQGLYQHLLDVGAGLADLCLNISLTVDVPFTVMACLRGVKTSSPRCSAS